MKKCLAKDADDRWQTARDLRDELKWIADLRRGRCEPLPLTTASPRAIGGRRALPWALAVAALVSTAVAWWAQWQPPPPLGTMRLNVSLGPDVVLANGPGSAAVLSPDGFVLAFVGQKIAGAGPQLYVRRLDQLPARPLSGSEGAETPFFSPDGQWIGFFAGGKLKKMAVAGSAVVTLCDVPNPRGGAWAEDDTIVFSYAGPGVSLQRVSSAGGTPTGLTSLAEGEVTQRWPQVLPGGKAVLYTGHNITTDFYDANIVVQLLPAGDREIVLRGGSHGRYLPSGHLLYVRSGALFAAPFDLDRLEVTGQPVPRLKVSSLTRPLEMRSSPYRRPARWCKSPGKPPAPGRRCTG